MSCSVAHSIMLSSSSSNSNFDIENSMKDMFTLEDNHEHGSRQLRSAQAHSLESSIPNNGAKHPRATFDQGPDDIDPKRDNSCAPDVLRELAYSDPATQAKLALMDDLEAQAVLALVSMSRQSLQSIDTTNADLSVCRSNSIYDKGLSASSTAKSKTRESSSNEQSSSSSTSSKKQPQKRKRNNSESLASATSPSPKKQKQRQKQNRENGEKPSSSGPSLKKSKNGFPSAEASRLWCISIKEIPFEDLPVCYPAKDRFVGKYMNVKQIIAECFRPELWDRAPVNNIHPSLSVDEQRFIYSNKGFSEDVYIDMKTRIFCCYHWRAIEDGIKFRIETAYWSVPKDVTKSRVLFHWYEELNMFPDFEGRSRMQIVAPRPKQLMPARLSSP